MTKNMCLKIQFGTKQLKWAEVTKLIKGEPSSFLEIHDIEQEYGKTKTAFENSFIVCSLYLEKELIGICRALSDGVKQSVVYDLNVSKPRQNKGYGSMLMNEILSKLPDGPVILYSMPGKEKYYKKFGFHMLRTGMGKFPNVERRIQRGFI